MGIQLEEPLTKLFVMKNLGPKSSEWLAAIGVHSLDDVAQLGKEELRRQVENP